MTTKWTYSRLDKVRYVWITFQYNVVLHTEMTTVELRSESAVTKDAHTLPMMGEVWSMFCQYMLHSLPIISECWVTYLRFVIKKFSIFLHHHNVLLFLLCSQNDPQGRVRKSIPNTAPGGMHNIDEEYKMLLAENTAGWILPLYRIAMGKQGCLTHWGRDKIAAVSQTTFSNAFSWMKMFEIRLRFHWSLFLRVQLTIFQHWFR